MPGNYEAEVKWKQIYQAEFISIQLDLVNLN